MADNVVFEVKTNAKKLERWVRNTLSGASDVEIKVKEATNNDKWGPTGKQMQEIASATFSFEHFDQIMKTVWLRLNDSGKYWRHVYKGLLLLEYLIKNGSEQVVRACHSNIRSIQTLTKFQHVTPKGKDEGENIRTRAKQIVELLSDDSRIREERKKAAETRKRFNQSISSEAGGFSGGSYGEPTDIDNENYGGYNSGGGGGYSGGGGYNDRGKSRHEDEKPYSSNERRSSYDDEEDQRQNTRKASASASGGGGRPRPPSTEIKKESAPPQQPKQQQSSLIDLFDTPSPSQPTNPQQQNPLLFQNPALFQQQQQPTGMTGFGQFQSPQQTQGFQANQMNQFQQNQFQANQFQANQFQQQQTTTGITGFGQFQGASSTPSTGFGQFQGASTTSSTISPTQTNQFQGGTTSSSPSSFGQFAGPSSPSSSGFGAFQSSSSSFDAFNPRGNESSGSGFANFENPSSPSQDQKKPAAFEGSHLVNLSNLIEDPSSKQTSQEKKTLGQTLQQKQQKQPLMQGGVLAPANTSTPVMGTPAVGGAGMVGNPGLVGNQGMVGNPGMVNPLFMNPQINTQNLTPQQQQLLQLQLQQQMLLLQQQQLQGGRGF